MNNAKELTAADLAMFLGAKCRVDVVDWYLDSVMEINLQMLSYVTDGVTVKPILRPLSDMTEEELLEFAKLCSGAEYVEIVESAISNYKNVMCFADFHDSERLVVNDRGEVWYASYFQNKPAGRNTINHHEQTVWLLRHHFDIFEWAKAGLAIDKTKTVTP